MTLAERAVAALAAQRAANVLRDEQEKQEAADSMRRETCEHIRGLFGQDYELSVYAIQLTGLPRRPNAEFRIDGLDFWYGFSGGDRDRTLRLVTTCPTCGGRRSSYPIESLEALGEALDGRLEFHDCRPRTANDEGGNQ
jgi:hypothetical protein